MFTFSLAEPSIDKHVKSLRNDSLGQHGEEHGMSFKNLLSNRPNPFAGRGVSETRGGHWENAPGHGLSKALSLAPRRPHPLPSLSLLTERHRRVTTKATALAASAALPCPPPSSHSREFPRQRLWPRPRPGLLRPSLPTFAPARARTTRSRPHNGPAFGVGGDGGLGGEVGTHR